jgi:hypothetical protein
MAQATTKGGGDDDLRLQVTKPARQAGLVNEGPDGEPGYMAEVYVYSFDGLLVILDKKVHMGRRADIISKAAGATESMHGGIPAKLAQAGNGYQVNLPEARTAGFEVKQDVLVRDSDAMLVIHDGTNAGVADDLQELRREQMGN